MRMSRHEAILDAALALPAEERAELTLKLIDSFDGDADEGVEAAWADEVSDRVAALREGRAEVVSFDEAMAVAHARVRTARG